MVRASLRRARSISHTLLFSHCRKNSTTCTGDRSLAHFGWTCIFCSLTSHQWGRTELHSMLRGFHFHPPLKSDLQNAENGDGRADEEINSVSDSFTSSSSEQRYYWQGTCFHNYEVPRWVQKSRQVSSDARPIYVEPRRAMQVAVNTRFSLIAIGTLRYLSFKPSR